MRKLFLAAAALTVIAAPASATDYGYGNPYAYRHNYHSYTPSYPTYSAPVVVYRAPVIVYRAAPVYRSYGYRTYGY